VRIGTIIIGLWVAFALSWLMAAAWAGKTEKRAGIGQEWPYRSTLAIGAILFFIPAHGYVGWMRLWRPSPTLAWVCVGLVAAGFAFCWWARIHLGRLWSGIITRKEDHYIVDTGPYALVRHPIYSGLLLAIAATMIAKGTLIGVTGAILIGASFYMKARLEERFLRQELGAATYERYSSRVSMLIPFT
jgi:protein-S-isoprenylcysteine O-methyltransferase Ste14